MKPSTPHPAERRPVRFSAYVQDETHLQAELQGWLLRAIERDSVSEVARRMNVNRRTVIRLRHGQAQFGIDTAFRLSRAYPDA